jgi:hypothetical protein
VRLGLCKSSRGTRYPIYRVIDAVGHVICLQKLIERRAGRRLKWPPLIEVFQQSRRRVAVCRRLEPIAVIVKQDTEFRFADARRILKDRIEYRL